MKETIEAIYENGLFRPLRRLHILEGQKIRLTVEKDEEVPTVDEEKLWLNSLSKNPAFAFLTEPEEDIYGPLDGKPLHD